MSGREKGKGTREKGQGTRDEGRKARGIVNSLEGAGSGVFANPPLSGSKGDLRRLAFSGLGVRAQRPAVNALNSSLSASDRLKRGDFGAVIPSKGGTDTPKL